jgi:hypothetical protein
MAQVAGEFTSSGIPLIAGALPQTSAAFGSSASIDGTLKSALMDFLARAARGPKEDRQFIAQMLSEPREHLFDSALEMPPSPGLLRVLGERQRAAADADGNESSPVGFGYDEALKAQAHPLDALTADFVESVFESVTAEPAISGAARAEIARLQPAALKAAVLDRTFFASRVHPMRRLLDRVTQAARDPGIDSSDGSEFVRELHDLVNSLNENFSDDLRTVETMIARVDDLADRYAGTARYEEAIDTRVLERSERERVAGIDAPSIFEFTTTDEQREIISYYNSSAELGRPIMLPPDVPPARVKLLRDSFMETMKDPEFLHDAKQLNYTITPRSGEALAAVIEGTMTTPAHLIEKTAKLTGAP